VTPERWQEVKQALSDVLALAPAERESYLRELRTQNADVAGEVESLLPHDTEATFLEQPAIAIGALGAGVAFGPYTIESALGEGGMGTVYLARDSSLERPVALKFLSRALQGEEDARRDSCAKPARPQRSITPTSARSTRPASRTADPSSRWNTSAVKRCGSDWMPGRCH
jgi:serine/threonine-protein kinase